MYECAQPNYPMNRSLSGAAFSPLTGLNQTATYCPGYQRCIVRGIGIGVGVTITGTPNLSFYKRSRAGDQATKVLIVAWTPTTGLALGNIHIKRDLQVVLNPGEDIVAEVIATAGAGNVSIVLYIDPVHENYKNVPNMIRAVH